MRISLMYRKLREREVDSLFVKGLINSFIDGKIHIPIIGTLHPHARYDIYTAFGQRMQSDERSRIVEDALICRNNLAYNSFNLFKILSIVNTDNPLYRRVN